MIKLAEILEREIFQTKVVEKIKNTFYVQQPFPINHGVN
jgi:hypothetical protein